MIFHFLGHALTDIGFGMVGALIIEAFLQRRATEHIGEYDSRGDHTHRSS